MPLVAGADRDRPFFFDGLLSADTPYVGPKPWFELYPVDKISLVERERGAEETGSPRLH